MGISKFIQLFGSQTLAGYGMILSMGSNHLHDDGPMPVTSRIGKTLRKRREELKLSQEEAARAAGISPMGLHFIETQQRYPTLDTVERLSKALNKPLAVVVVEASMDQLAEG